MRRKQLRICLVTKSRLEPSGLGYTVHDLANELTEMGHSAHVVVTRPRSPHRESLVESASARYHVHRIWLPRTKGLLHDFLMQLAIRHLHSRHPFDVFHLHPLYPTGYEMWRRLRALEVPIVINGHGVDIEMQPEYGYGLRLDPGVDAKVRTLLASEVSLVAIGEAMKREMIMAGADPNRIAVIRTGLYVSDFERADPWPHGKPYIFSMGRLIPKKGYDLLIDAFATLSRRLDRCVDLLIAGEGELKQALLGQIRRLGLQDRVRLLGFVGEGQREALLRGCLFFVCPSRREAMGHVNLEALAAGKPVVAFAVDGIPDYIYHGQNGLLAERENAADLARNMHDMLTDPQLFANLSRNAVASVRQYDWGQVRERYVRFYHETIARYNPASSGPAGRATM